MISKLFKKPFVWIALGVLLLIVIGALYLINAIHNISTDIPANNINRTTIQDINNFNTEIRNKVDALLTDIIEKAPKALSYPYDHLKDSDALQKLVQLGWPAMNYMFESFSKSNDDGPREYVMACACAKIIGIYDDDKGIDADTGMEWFNKHNKFQRMDNFHQADADYNRYDLSKDSITYIIYSKYHSDNVDKTKIDDVVSDYIIKLYRNEYPVGEKGVEAHKILGSEEKSGVTYLYLQVGFYWFGFENGIFTPVSGGSDVVRMKLSKSDTGEYEVVDYKYATRGSMWEKSIKDMFPENLAEEVIRDNKAIDKELWNIQADKVRAYLKEIDRGDALVQPTVKKNTESEGVQRAIHLVTLMRNGFPDWNGNREMLIQAMGGPGLIFNIRCILETRCEPVWDGSYNITLTRAWYSAEGAPLSTWKYNVSGDKIKLVEYENNDDFLCRIK